jgi:hypothetical protein
MTAQTPTRVHVGFWHFSDVPTHQTNVRHWGNSGLKSDIAEWPNLTQSGRYSQGRSNWRD